MIAKRHSRKVLHLFLLDGRSRHGNTRTDPNLDTTIPLVRSRRQHRVCSAFKRSDLLGKSLYRAISLHRRFPVEIPLDVVFGGARRR